MGTRKTRPINLNHGLVMYQRVPTDAREDIDRAIVDRPEGLRTIAHVYRHFEIEKKYGVGMTAFRAYARRVAYQARGESVGTIARGLCHVEGIDDEALLQKRGRLLLIQQIIRTLEEGELTTPELQKMAQAYSAQRKVGLAVDKAEQDMPVTPDEEGDMAAQLSELVREVYGSGVGEIGEPQEEAREEEPEEQVQSPASGDEGGPETE